MSDEFIAPRPRAVSLSVLKIAGLAELAMLGALTTADVAAADGMPTPGWAGEKAQNAGAQNADIQNAREADKSLFVRLKAMIEQQQQQLEKQAREITELQQALAELQTLQSQAAPATPASGVAPRTATGPSPHVANTDLVVEARRRGIEEPRLAPNSAQEAVPFDASTAIATTATLESVRGAGTPNSSTQSAPQIAQTSGQPREHVGERPPEEKKAPPELPAIADVGGVLTPPGVLTVEPGLTLSHTSTSRFLFRGVEILPSFLIGLIEVTEADREYAGLSVGMRYGLIDRLEASLSVPFVARADDITTSGASLGANSDQRDVSGYGLGDIEAGLQYQINSGKEDWPVMVANLKVKIPTGQGPFDVDRDPQNGLETELPTGSGFWGIQPSLTIIKSMDPLVFYGNLNYVLNLPKDIDQQISTANGTALILDVDPGDAIGISFGGALAITENVSMSLGYEHYYVMSTEQTASTFVPFNPTPPTPPLGAFGPPVKTKGSDAQVGSLLFGVNFREDDGGSYSLTLSAGLTDDAPDVQIAIRRPFSFDVGAF